MGALSALIVTITLGILVVTKVIGSWALIIMSAIAAVVGLLRYRSEAAQKKRDADAQGE